MSDITVTQRRIENQWNLLFGGHLPFTDKAFGVMSHYVAILFATPTERSNFFAKIGRHSKGVSTVFGKSVFVSSMEA